MSKQKSLLSLSFEKWEVLVWLGSLSTCSWWYIFIITYASSLGPWDEILLGSICLCFCFTLVCPSSLVIISYMKWSYLRRLLHREETRKRCQVGMNLIFLLYFNSVHMWVCAYIDVCMCESVPTWVCACVSVGADGVQKCQSWSCTPPSVDSETQTLVPCHSRMCSTPLSRLSHLSYWLILHLCGSKTWF